MRLRPLALLLALLPGTALAQVTPKQFEQWRSEIRSALYIPTPLPVLATQTYSTFSPAEGVLADRVTYATEFGMRVPAIVYHPAHAHGRLPAMVILAGHGGDKYSWYEFYAGILYARAGGVVLTYDTIGEGERNIDRKSITRAHDAVIGTPHAPARMGGLMITDAMQAVSYLLTRPDVDPNRIALAGYSMGSFIGALTGALDTRIHALILSAGGTLDANSGFWDNSSKIMCEAGPYRALSFLPDKAAILMALNQLRGPTFILNGLDDTQLDIPHHAGPFFNDLRTRTTALTGTQQNIFMNEFIPGAGHRPSWVTRTAALWLQQQLHFPNWTEAKIAALPTTHISAWVKEKNVIVEERYMTELNEGGILALGDDIPNIPRTQLNVLSDAEWQKQKSKLIYESWAEKARTADNIH